MTVYQLQAVGTDYLTNGSSRFIYSTTVFTTRERAESRVEAMREAVVKARLLSGDYPIHVTVEPLEVIDDAVATEKTMTRREQCDGIAALVRGERKPVNEMMDWGVIVKEIQRLTLAERSATKPGLVCFVCGCPINAYGECWYCTNVTPAALAERNQ